MFEMMDLSYVTVLAQRPGNSPQLHLADFQKDSSCAALQIHCNLFKVQTGIHPPEFSLLQFSAVWFQLIVMSSSNHSEEKSSLFLEAWTLVGI